MLHTGHQDLSLFESKNFVIEKVSTLPLYSVAYIGRVVFVTTPGPNFGLHQGGVSSWERLESGTTQAFRFLELLYWHVPANVTADLTLLTGANYQAGVAGYITDLSIFLTESISGGTVILKPTINGTPVATTELTATLITGEKFKYKQASGALPALAYIAGDIIGVQAITDISFAPLNSTNAFVKLLDS